MKEQKYKIKFYIDQETGISPVLDYISKKPDAERQKIFKFLDFLRQKEGYLDEPYAKHITGKIRELRVNVSRNYHRIFYFTFVNKNIIILHAFLKRTAKTPSQEIKKASELYQKVINDKDLYGQE